MSLYSLQNNHTTGGTWRKYGVAAKRLQIKKRLISANSSEYAHGAGALLTVKTKVVLPGYDGHSS